MPSRINIFGGGGGGGGGVLKLTVEEKIKQVLRERDCYTGSHS